MPTAAVALKRKKQRSKAFGFFSFDIRLQICSLEEGNTLGSLLLFASLYKVIKQRRP